MLAIGPGIGVPYGGASWNPLMLSNLVTWYDTSDINTLWQDTGRSTPVTGDGDDVKVIDDKSGNGHHLTRSNSDTYKGLYESDGIGGRGSVKSDNGTAIASFETSTIAALGLTQPVHVVSVMELTVDNGSFNFAWGFDLLPYVFWNINSNRYELNSGSDVRVLETPLLDTPTRTEAYVKGVNSSLAVKAGAVDDSTNGDAGSTDPETELTLFDRDGPAGTFDGFFGELVLVDGLIPESELISLRAYLDAKWSV